jgi:hypothetical protein
VVVDPLEAGGRVGRRVEPDRRRRIELELRRPRGHDDAVPVEERDAPVRALDLELDAERWRPAQRHLHDRRLDEHGRAARGVPAVPGARRAVEAGSDHRHAWSFS